MWKNTSDNVKIYDTFISEQNPYIGGKTQQATSALTNTNQSCYELSDGCSSVYGFEVRTTCSSYSLTHLKLTHSLI